MELIKGWYYKITGDKYIKDGVYEYFGKLYEEDLFYIGGVARDVDDGKISLPTEIEDAYPGAILENENGKRKVFQTTSFGVNVSCQDLFDKWYGYCTCEELRTGKYELLPQALPTPQEPEDEREARELLEQRGRIKDGKVIAD